MAQRFLKIILPKAFGKTAMGMLSEKPDLKYWQEEASAGILITFTLSAAILHQPRRCGHLSDSRYYTPVLVGSGKGQTGNPKRNDHLDDYSAGLDRFFVFMADIAFTGISVTADIE